MSKCTHASNGCNYPEAECAGAVYRYPSRNRARWGLWLALGGAIVAAAAVRACT